MACTGMNADDCMQGIIFHMETKAIWQRLGIHGLRTCVNSEVQHFKRFLLSDWLTLL